MVKIEKENDILIAGFENLNRFNALVADPVKEELKAYFKQNGIKMILNLDGIRFVDSTGFGVFLSLLKEARSTQGQFKMCNIAPEVMELFKLLQLQNIFELYSSLEECKSSFN